MSELIKETQENKEVSSKDKLVYPDTPTSVFYVRLQQFEGPLDLLLHLVRESKLSIREIKLASITQPFLDYMNEMEFMDLEKASEFLDIATTLIEIKVKALLPKIDEMFIVEPEDDPEERLKQRIEKYELFKQASDKLKDIEDVSKFFKAPDLNAGDFKIVLKDLNLDDLLNAFSKMLHKVEIKKSEPPKSIVKDRFTVKDKLEYIEKYVTLRKTISFFELFDADYSKSEIINTFLALLELLKLQKIYVEQNGIYEDITINYRGEREDAS